MHAGLLKEEKRNNWLQKSRRNRAAKTMMKYIQEKKDKVNYAKEADGQAGDLENVFW